MDYFCVVKKHIMLLIWFLHFGWMKPFVRNINKIIIKIIMQGIRVKVDEGREYYSLMDCWPLARFLSRKTSNNSGKVGMEKFFTYLKHYKNAKSH